MTHVLAIRVTPRSAKPGIEGWRPGADGRQMLRIRVAEAPADGAANEAVVALLAKALGISRSQVSIISGHTARNKRVQVPLGAEEVRRRIGS